MVSEKIASLSCKLSPVFCKIPNTSFTSSTLVVSTSIFFIFFLFLPRLNSSLLSLACFSKTSCIIIHITCSMIIFNSRVVDQINDSVAVSILVVIPGHKLDKCSRKLNSSFGVEDRGAIISQKVGRDNHVLGVSKNSLHGTLRCLLDLSTNFLIGSRFLKSDSQINNRNIRSWHTECHSSQFSIEGRNDFANSLGSSGRGRNDVLSCSTSSSPVLATRSIDCLLSCCNCMDSCHQTLKNTEVVIHDLGKWSQTVGCTRGIAHNLHISRISILIDSHDKHRSISRWSRDDDLLSSSLVMSSSFLQSGENSSGLNHILGANTSPRDGRGIPLTEDSDGLSIHNQLSLYN